MKESHLLSYLILFSIVCVVGFFTCEEILKRTQNIFFLIAMGGFVISFFWLWIIIPLMISDNSFKNKNLIEKNSNIRDKKVKNTFSEEKECLK